MGLSKLFHWAAPLLLVASLTCAAEERDWKQGAIISAQTLRSPYKSFSERRYRYVVYDEGYSYTPYSNVQ
jgi:hypothetical protein